MTDTIKENDNAEKNEPLTLKDIDKAFSLAYVDLFKRMKRLEEKMDLIIMRLENHG